MAEQTILVVDDEVSIQVMVARTLEAEGYQVQTANGPDALDLVRDAQRDLLILDVQMPVLDGIEISRRLRANPATAHIPIVAMTALPEYARQHGMQADAWLPKPFDLDDLYQIVATLIDHPKSGILALGSG